MWRPRATVTLWEYAGNKERYASLLVFIALPLHCVHMNHVHILEHMVLALVPLGEPEWHVTWQNTLKNKTTSPSHFKFSVFDSVTSRSCESARSEETGRLLLRRTVNHPKHKLHMSDMQHSVSAPSSDSCSYSTTCSVFAPQLKLFCPTAHEHDKKKTQAPTCRFWLWQTNT